MKRVFLSFRAEDEPQIKGVRLLAANPRHDIEFYDESVRTAINSQNAAYIRQQIRAKINRTSVTVCMVNALTHTSQWVDWELEESLDKGNTIIFMGVPGHPDRLRLPALGVRLQMPWWAWDVDDLARRIEGAP